MVAVWRRLKARFVWTLGCRPGDADKSPPNPTTLTFLSPSPSLMFLPQSHNTHMLTSAGSSLWLTGLAIPSCQTSDSTSSEGGYRACVRGGGGGGGGGGWAHCLFTNYRGHSATGFPACLMRWAAKHA